MNAYYQQYFSGPWTEIIYNARVKAIVKSLEQLVLIVAGLTPESSKITLGPYGQYIQAKYDTFKFNIQFSLPLNRYLTMQSALSQVQASLLRAKQITNEAGIMDKATRDPASLTNPFWIQSMLFPTEPIVKCRPTPSQERTNTSFTTAF